MFLTTDICVFVAILKNINYEWISVSTHTESIKAFQVAKVSTKKQEQKTKQKTSQNDTIFPSYQINYSSY